MIESSGYHIDSFLTPTVNSASTKESILRGGPTSFSDCKSIFGSSNVSTPTEENFLSRSHMRHSSVLNNPNTNDAATSLLTAAVSSLKLSKSNFLQNSGSTLFGGSGIIGQSSLSHLSSPSHLLDNSSSGQSVFGGEKQRLLCSSSGGSGATASSNTASDEDTCEDEIDLEIKDNVLVNNTFDRIVGGGGGSSSKTDALGCTASQKRINSVSSASSSCSSSGIGISPSPPAISGGGGPPLSIGAGGTFSTNSGGDNSENTFTDQICCSQCRDASKGQAIAMCFNCGHKLCPQCAIVHLKTDGQCNVKSTSSSTTSQSSTNVSELSSSSSSTCLDKMSTCNFLQRAKSKATSLQTQLNGIEEGGMFTVKQTQEVRMEVENVASLLHGIVEERKNEMIRQLERFQKDQCGMLMAKKVESKTLLATINHVIDFVERLRMQMNNNNINGNVNSNVSISSCTNPPNALFNNDNNELNSSINSSQSQQMDKIALLKDPIDKMTSLLQSSSNSTFEDCNFVDFNNNSNKRGNIFKHLNTVQLVERSMNEVTAVSAIKALMGVLKSSTQLDPPQIVSTRYQTTENLSGGANAGPIQRPPVVQMNHNRSNFDTAITTPSSSNPSQTNGGFKYDNLGLTTGLNSAASQHPQYEQWSTNGGGNVGGPSPSMMNSSSPWMEPPASSSKLNSWSTGGGGDYQQQQQFSNGPTTTYSKGASSFISMTSTAKSAAIDFSNSTTQSSNHHHLNSAADSILDLSTTNASANGSAMMGSQYGSGQLGFGNSNNVKCSSLPAIKRQKMIYHCKFGAFGVIEGQFTEPSGVAVNAQNEIIVADTNNHRIQVFDKDGRFKYQFGTCGKKDGELLYPNRVAVFKQSGDIVVTERSPTHQVQIYNQYGQFVRKFGSEILQHPRGVCVDNQGRIVVVECKVMRVIIFDQMGNVLNKFGCSKHLEFPNGVVVNDRQEIFISDNRAHCVKVFNYDGEYLRQIGGEGMTNYPIGVGINSAGEVTIADNHNNFNLSIFSQDGHLIKALESKVKHAQCFDVSLMGSGSVVLASKDYHIYVYRYVPISPIGTTTSITTNCAVGGGNTSVGNQI